MKSAALLTSSGQMQLQSLRRTLVQTLNDDALTSQSFHGLSHSGHPSAASSPERGTLPAHVLSTSMGLIHNSLHQSQSQSQTQADSNSPSRPLASGDLLSEIDRHLNGAARPTTNHHAVSAVPPSASNNNDSANANDASIIGSPSSLTARPDGKDFFRRARARLSYDAFNEFLANIKKLNLRTQSREQTLAECRRIFGPEGNDLFTGFQQLLSRHV
jgi:hypothetical protein